MFDFIKRQFLLTATHRRTIEEIQQRNLVKKNAFFKFMRVVCIVGIIFIILNMILMFNTKTPHSWGFLFVGWWVDLGTDRRKNMEVFGIMGFIFGLGALGKIIMLEKQLKESGVLKEQTESDDK